MEKYDPRKGWVNPNMEMDQNSSEQFEEKTTTPPKVSIIVPVYRVENYIRQCVESILRQTYNSFELILVDDGSPDRSGAICDEYAKNDSRVRVIHKENGGVSSARNRGIDEAKGEWITFVDADDSIDQETLSKCSRYFEMADMVRFSMRFIYSEDMKSYRDFTLSEVTKEDYLSMIIARETIMGVWGGFYLRKMFVDNNIRFDENLISGEDWVVLVHLVALSREISIIVDPLYYYNKINENSCTYSYSFKRSFSTLRAFNKIECLLSDLCLDGYERPLSKAKCEIGGDFYSCLFRGRHNVAKKDVKAYSSLLNISRRDIRLGGSSCKRRFFLMTVRSSIGRTIIGWLTK